ncbi:MAG: hypothetical protein K2H85_06575, partial [Allobaculum sp.]|nr:hypothetical protein [Allobaculum sp.]
DEASSDEASSDEASSDEASSDEASSDEASSDAVSGEAGEIDKADYVEVHETDMTLPAVTGANFSISYTLSGETPTLARTVFTFDGKETAVPAGVTLDNVKNGTAQITITLATATSLVPDKDWRWPTAGEAPGTVDNTTIVLTGVKAVEATPIKADNLKVEYVEVNKQPKAVGVLFSADGTDWQSINIATMSDWVTDSDIKPATNMVDTVTLPSFPTLKDGSVIPVQFTASDGETVTDVAAEAVQQIVLTNQNTRVLVTSGKASASEFKLQYKNPGTQEWENSGEQTDSGVAIDTDL